MAMLDSTVSALRRPYSELEIDEAQLAAVGFLARYGGRTLDAYRHDLRGFFQWAADVGLPVLEATRPHIELYRTTLEERGLAASTIDRRLSTGVWLLSLRSHRRKCRFEPGPVRPAASGASVGCAWAGPL